MLKFQLVFMTGLGSLDNIPAAYKDVFQNVAEAGDKWLDSSTRCLGDGNDVEGEFVMMKEDSFELGCHIGRGHLKVLAKGGAVAPLARRRTIMSMSSSLEA